MNSPIFTGCNLWFASFSHWKCIRWRITLNILPQLMDMVWFFSSEKIQQKGSKKIVISVVWKNERAHWHIINTFWVHVRAPPQYAYTNTCFYWLHIVQIGVEGERKASLPRIRTWLSRCCSSRNRSKQKYTEQEEEEEERHSHATQTNPLPFFIFKVIPFCLPSHPPIWRLHAIVCTYYFWGERKTSTCRMHR